MLETPRSEQCSANLLSRHVPDVSLLLRIHGPQVPDWCDIVLEPGVVADLPQRGGINFRPCPNLSSMVSLRLELPPADINMLKEMAPNQKSLLSPPPQQARGRNTTTPPTIMEDSSDLPNSDRRENTADGNFSSVPSLDPSAYPQNARGAIHRMINETVLDDEAFPADRLMAAQFLEEAGLTPPILLPETPKRCVPENLRLKFLNNSRAYRF